MSGRQAVLLLVALIIVGAAAIPHVERIPWRERSAYEQRGTTEAAIPRTHFPPILCGPMAAHGGTAYMGFRGEAVAGKRDGRK